MATYYVDITTGNDADDGLSEGNAWQTFAKTQSNPIAAGDLVYVKGSATYTTRLIISVVGTATAQIVFEGYTTTPGDGGMVTVTDTVNNTGLTPGAGSNFYTFRNFRFTGMSGVGAGNLTSDHLVYKKCRADTNGSDGFQGDQNCMFEGCYAHGNTGDGFDVGGPTVFVCCIANANGLNGFAMETGVCYRCEAFSNAGNGFDSSQAGYHSFFDCVCDGDVDDTSVGFNLAIAYGQSQITVVNCSAYDCATGFTGPASTGLQDRIISRNNHVNGNATAYTNWKTWEGEVTSAPAFVNEASQDYTPAVGSPLIAAGFGVDTHNWITRTGPAPCIGSGPQVAAAGGGSPGIVAMLTGGRM